MINTNKKINGFLECLEYDGFEVLCCHIFEESIEHLRILVKKNKDIINIEKKNDDEYVSSLYVFNNNKYEKLEKDIYIDSDIIDLLYSIYENSDYNEYNNFSPIFENILKFNK